MYIIRRQLNIQTEKTNFVRDKNISYAIKTAEKYLKQTNIDMS